MGLSDHTYQDKFSTMAYELYLLKRNEMTDSDQAWITSRWNAEEPIHPDYHVQILTKHRLHFGQSDWLP